MVKLWRFCLDPTRLRPYPGTGISGGTGSERLTVAQQLQCSDVTVTRSTRVAFCTSDDFKQAPERYPFHPLVSAKLDRHDALLAPATEVSAGLLKPVISDNEDNGVCVSLVKAHGQRRLITVPAEEGHCGFPAEQSCPPGIQSPIGWL